MLNKSPGVDWILHVCSALFIAHVLSPVGCTWRARNGSSERPKMFRASTFEHLPYFLLKNPEEHFAIYNDSKHLKKAVYTSKWKGDQETGDSEG